MSTAFIETRCDFGSSLEIRLFRECFCDCLERVEDDEDSDSVEDEFTSFPLLSGFSSSHSYSFL